MWVWIAGYFSLPGGERRALLSQKPKVAPCFIAEALGLQVGRDSTYPKEKNTGLPVAHLILAVKRLRQDH